MSNSEIWLELEVICHLELNEKRDWDVWVGKASYGMGTRKSIVNKDC